jgi:hypothetical protein
VALAILRSIPSSAPAAIEDDRNLRLAG